MPNRLVDSDVLELVDIGGKGSVKRCPMGHVEANFRMLQTYRGLRVRTLTHWLICRACGRNNAPSTLREALGIYLKKRASKLWALKQKPRRIVRSPLIFDEMIGG